MQRLDAYLEPMTVDVSPGNLLDIVGGLVASGVGIFSSPSRLISLELVGSEEVKTLLPVGESGKYLKRNFYFLKLELSL